MLIYVLLLIGFLIYIIVSTNNETVRKQQEELAEKQKEIKLQEEQRQIELRLQDGLVEQQRQIELKRQEELAKRQRQMELKLQDELVQQLRQIELKKQVEFAELQRESEIKHKNELIQRFGSFIEEYLSTCNQLSQIKSTSKYLDSYVSYVEKKLYELVEWKSYDFEFSFVNGRLNLSIDFHEHTLNEVSILFSKLIRFCADYYTELTVIHGYNNGTVLRDYLRSYLNENIISRETDIDNDGITIFKIYNEKLIEQRHERENKKRIAKITKLEAKKKSLEEMLKSNEVFISDIVKYETRKREKIEEIEREEAKKFREKSDEEYKAYEKEKLTKVAELERNKILAKQDEDVLLSKLSDEQKQYYIKLKNGNLAFYQLPKKLITRDFGTLLRKHYSLYNKLDTEIRNYIDSII